MADESSCRDLMKNAAPIAFGLIIICGFFYVMYSLLAHDYPAANKDQINSMIELVKNTVILVVGFFFGSSASNKTKDETISDIAKMPINSAPSGPISIPDAKSVSVKTESGDVNLSKE